MAQRLSGQTSIFVVVSFVSKSLLEIERQKKLVKFTILTRKPRSPVRILIYRTWLIVNFIRANSLLNIILLPKLFENAAAMIGIKGVQYNYQTISKLKILKQFTLFQESASIRR